MARIARNSDGSSASRLDQDATRQPEATRRSPRKKTSKTYAEGEDLGCNEPAIKARPLPKGITSLAKNGKQVRLTPLKNMRDMSDLSSKLLGTTLLDEPGPTRIRSPAKKPSCTVLKALNVQPLARHQPAEIDEQLDVEESVWCGSDTTSETSDDELPSPRKFIKFPSRKAGGDVVTQPGLDLTRSLELLTLSKRPVLNGMDGREISDSSRPSSSSDKENNDRATLRFLPPRLHSPPKQRLPSRPSTPPPASPTKGRLLSPSKRMARVPTPPFRQSLDAFWNVEKVNDWNNQYSPRKEWSPKKERVARDDASASPTGSPKKSQSPTKRTKVELAAKKDWETRKHRVAEAFLAELDAKITDGQVGELSASTGGVHFVWSKTLNTTAGRANWKRETTKTRQIDGSITVVQKHHASIELAEKVIDDEERLLNVVAHEFCHLANFMVSGIKDQPHGRQFKEWGRKCTRAFGSRGVEVTTKHSYQIEYKYVWRCSGDECGTEFKRHSKSIDPKRQKCGACRNKLVQIKPVPRKEAVGGDGAPTGYAGYVKKHYASVKAELGAGVGQKEVMEAVGRRYRAEKAGTALQGQSQDGALLGPEAQENSKRGSSSSAIDVSDMVRGMEVITIEDD
ncbi:hypothetical protein LTS12_018820 [Elasticomyces elasticus]|nr:hypothetical protein LTS12_018820 [Elasticomyces elasticus]